jgi:hypothetical protein
MKRIYSTILMLPFVAGVRYRSVSMLEFDVGHSSEYDTSMQADASEKDYCGEENPNKLFEIYQYPIPLITGSDTMIGDLTLSSDKYIIMAEIEGASTELPAGFPEKVIAVQMKCRKRAFNLIYILSKSKKREQ